MSAAPKRARVRVKDLLENLRVSLTHVREDMEFLVDPNTGGKLLEFYTDVKHFIRIIEGWQKEELNAKRS
jgi:hypothetical protein